MTRLNYLVEIFAVTLIYIITARVGQIFAIPPGNITPVWIPSGVMLAWAIIRGNYVWPGIFLGAFIGNVWAYADLSSLSTILRSLLSGSANGIGDVICTIGSAYFFTLYTNDANPFKNLKAFLYLFIFGVILGPLISATFGVNALLLTGFLPNDSYIVAYVTWFIGDSVGVLLFAPLILLGYFPNNDPVRKIGLHESIPFFISLILIPFMSFLPDSLIILKQQPAIVIVPVLIWCVLRMSQTIVFYSAAYLSVTSIILSYLGQSLFKTDAQFQSVLMLQLFIIVTISSVFILSALIHEKENILAQLKKNYDFDSLTKIYNRQYFERQVKEEIERHARYDSTFCVIMYDIDFFKAVNDTFGHLVGDEVLVNLSAIVATEIRDIDTLARWGGEEFIILMPQTKLEGAKIIAERIRQQVEQANLLPKGKLTISLGLIEYSDQDDSKSYLKRLDDALYDAKDNGRNRLKYT
jgi:diguanylate cyclase (GGDEF)-like protein